MNCGEVDNLKHAYADRELDPVRSTEIDSHLSGCHSCSQAYQNIRSLSSAVKSANLYYKAPDGLEDSIRASLGLEDRNAPRFQRASKPRPWWRQWMVWPLPIAGTATLTFLLALLLLRPGADDRLAQEVTASHVRSLMAAHLTDVTSTDQHTVKPWFDGKIDFAPPVIELAPQGFPLQGGRLDYLDDHLVAALVYHRNKHIINLFIWPTDTRPSPAKRLVVHQGYNLIHWTGGGMAYWAISNLNSTELRQFADLMQ